MRTIKTAVAFLLITCLYTPGICQVTDIGISFTKKGFVQNISDHSLLVNYSENSAIYTENLRVTDKTIVEFDSRNSSFDKLKPGMEITATGEYFESTKSSVATKISVNTGNGKDIIVKDGRLDKIDGDFAFVDGQKIMLEPGKKINGARKTGYDGKSFNSFRELKLGALISFKGKYNDKGYTEVSNITIAPEFETEDDKKTKEYTRELHDELYKVWTDPSKRASLFGKNLGPVGNVINNSQLQDYVNKLGLSLVPPHVKDKLKFMFIVTDNPNWNANVRADGLSFVYLGLLVSMENEAQLAAVLGHEISHAIYEHSAERASNNEQASLRKEKRAKTASSIKEFVDKVKPNVTLTDNNGRKILSKDLKTETSDLIIRDLPNAKTDKILSDYSVENELQADRVGMMLMVNAGYDPREATIVWKNMFNSIDHSQRTGNTSEKKQEERTNRNADLIDIASGYLKKGIRSKVDDLKEQSKKTHPEDIKRYEALNRLIGQYYPDLQTLKTGEETYKAVFNPFLKEYVAALNAEEQRVEQEKKRRPQLDKQFKETLPKTKAKLATITKPILTYKEYQLKPIVNIKTLSGTLKSNYPEITSRLDNMQENYQFLAQKVQDFVDQANKGEIEPHKKDREFAYWYLLSKNLNELAINFSTAVSIGDIENTHKHFIERDDLIYIIDNIQNRQEYEEMLGFLSKK